jgi:hypothetical protein
MTAGAGAVRKRRRRPVHSPSFRGASQRVRPKAGSMTGSASEPGVHNPRPVIMDRKSGLPRV